MAITRTHGKVAFVCDECGDSLETEEKDWDDAVQMMRGEKWRAVKLEDWEHYCPSCWEGRSDK